MSTPLPQLSRKLAERTGQAAPGYRRIYKAIVDGQVRAEKIGREWVIDDDQLPTLERVLGLTTPTVT